MISGFLAGTIRMLNTFHFVEPFCSAIGQTNQLFGIFLEDSILLLMITEPFPVSLSQKMVHHRWDEWYKSDFTNALGSGLILFNLFAQQIDTRFPPINHLLRSRLEP